jgi:prenyltransferase beta subunit
MTVEYGGFGKWADSYPDVLHSYMGLSGLSISGEESLQPLFTPLGISARAHEWGIKLKLFGHPNSERNI